MEAFKSGGRQFHVGAGTSGRLGVLEAADGHVKTALPMLLADADADEATADIERCDGFVGHAIAGTTSNPYGHAVGVSITRTGIHRRRAPTGI